MSWLYSRALVEAFSAGTCSDGEPSALSSGNPTPQAYSSPGKTTVASRLSRYGMTCEPLTESRGEELLTWFRAGFPVKTSALPAKEPESTASGRECGRTWRGWSAKYDPDSSTWKTAQHSLLEDSDESSVTWPRSGMTRDGMLWELPTLELTTRGIGSGLWPTPIANDAEKRGDFDPIRSWGLAGAARLFPSVLYPVAGQTRHIPMEVRLDAAAQRWPTPTCHDGTQVDPDPHRDGRRKQPCLGTLVNMTAGSRGGQLNPTWVEWLMGWPSGWTDLKPLAMDRFHEWQQQHSKP